MSAVAIGLHLHLSAPGRRVNAIENHFHQQMVIWRSLSPSVLARVLELAATRLRREPAALVRRRDRPLRLVGEAATAVEPNKVSPAQSVPGE
jgi:hypothetical protein